MSGGKTRTITELAFDWALDYPSILLPLFRQVKVHIIDTTRRTFFEQVLPPELRARPDLIRVKRSQGEDYVEFWNGSQIHFVGLDNPGRVFSAEFGAAIFDEAHEISEEDVLTVNTRLRQRCRDCVHGNLRDCRHMPRKLVFAFNPSFPGHWLHQWFIQGAERSEFGYRKKELIASEAESTLGTAEYFIARATDNPFVPPEYIEKNLAGMSKLMRQRFLEGRWLHISGHGFFDEEAIAGLQEFSEQNAPLMIGEADGDFTGATREKPPRIVERSGGRLHVFKAPVRYSINELTGDEVKPHRYVIGVDTSSGASADYSGIQVLDVDEFEQVAEWQGKIDPDTLAEIAFLLGCVYNGAMLAPEVNTFGFAVVKRIQKLISTWQGPAGAKPKLFMRPVTNRLATKFTDLLGWDTNTGSRALMLSTLEAAIREEGVIVHGTRTVAELSAFAFPTAKPGMDYRSPRAQAGEHDDLVIPLAIAVTVAARMPRTAVRMPRRDERVAFTAAGF